MLLWITQHRWLMLAIGIVLLATAVVAALWFFVVRSPGTPVNLRQAVQQYRRTQAFARRAVSSLLPPPGVYQYRTSGGERLNLGISRSFPSVTNMVVVDGRCTEMRWEPLQQHTEGLVVCPQHGGALTMTSTSSTEDIAGITTHMVIDCPTGSYFVPPHPSRGQHWHTTCQTAGHNVSLTGRVVGETSASVGGWSTPVLHTRITFDFSGSTSGTNPTEYWVIPRDGLIVRQVETVDISEGTGPLGAVRYHEQAAIQLASMAPHV